MVKGFVLDDERLKKGGNIFGKEYFDELLERVQEIRASERLFYQKLTDIFAVSTECQFGPAGNTTRRCALPFWIDSITAVQSCTI